MATLSDYVSGTISLTTGSVDFTGSATGWLLASFKEGDTIIDITGATEFMGVIAEITSNTAGKLTKAWEGPNLVDAPYRMRYQADGSRVSAQARNLIELLGDGTLTSLAGLTGPGVIELLPGGGAQVVPKTDLVSGANYDVQVSDLAGRAVYDGQAEGFSVLVADVGDGRSAIYSKASNASADWTDPAYVTGPIGETPDVTVGTVTTGAPGTDVEVTATPITGGVELDFTIPAGEGFSAKGAYSGATAYAKGDVVRDAGSSWIALQATTGNAPPTLPTTSNAYWELVAAKGQDGEIDGVTPFWQSRILNDVDAAAARTGLELVKQTSETDDTAGRLLTVGAFGVGKTAFLAAPDLSQVRPTGTYYVSSPTNGPGGVTNGWLEVRDLDAGHSLQTVINVANGIRYSNLRLAGVWQGWTRNQLEYGSNANGRYVRDYSTRMQWCFGRVGPRNVAIVTTGTTTGILFSALQTHTYPAAFASSPEVVVMNVAGNLTWVAAGAAPGTSTCSYYLLAPSSEASRSCTESIHSHGIF